MPGQVYGSYTGKVTRCISIICTFIHANDHFPHSGGNTAPCDNNDRPVLCFLGVFSGSVYLSAVPD